MKSHFMSQYWISPHIPTQLRWRGDNKRRWSTYRTDTQITAKATLKNMYVSPRPTDSLFFFISGISGPFPSFPKINSVPIFSSPDPKGHVSYCHHLSSVRKHFNLLLENHWSKWGQTWQESSFAWSNQVLLLFLHISHRVAMLTYVPRWWPSWIFNRSKK
jgi:hypothetical protein